MVPIAMERVEKKLSYLSEVNLRGIREKHGIDTVSLDYLPYVANTRLARIERESSPFKKLFEVLTLMSKVMDIKIYKYDSMGLRADTPIETLDWYMCHRIDNYIVERNNPNSARYNKIIHDFKRHAIEKRFVASLRKLATYGILVEFVFRPLGTDEIKDEFLHLVFNYLLTRKSLTPMHDMAIELGIQPATMEKMLYTGIGKGKDTLKIINHINRVLTDEAE